MYIFVCPSCVIASVIYIYIKSRDLVVGMHYSHLSLCSFLLDVSLPVIYLNISQLVNSE